MKPYNLHSPFSFVAHAHLTQLQMECCYLIERTSREGLKRGIAVCGDLSEGCMYSIAFFFFFFTRVHQQKGYKRRAQSAYSMNVLVLALKNRFQDVISRGQIVNIHHTE